MKPPPPEHARNTADADEPPKPSFWPFNMPFFVSLRAQKRDSQRQQ